MRSKMLWLCVGLAIVCGVARVLAISVNPASSVTADSANTATTIVYRDTSGNFAASNVALTYLSIGPGKTTTQLLLIAPAVGDVYYCSNCSPAKIVVATGTAAGNFADAVGGTFK